MPSIYNRLFSSLKKLPGLGDKQAERLIFYFLNQDENQINELVSSILDFKRGIKRCTECGLISEQDPCRICTSSKRDNSHICIVKSIQDALHIERAKNYNGLYHVLGGLLSPLKNITENDLNINSLIERIKKLPVKEIILALDNTIEGEATTTLITESLKESSLEISRLAMGIPYGTDLEYIDGETLKNSFFNRTSLKK